MIAWSSPAAAAELQGFQRVWVHAEALALTPVGPPAGAELAGVRVDLNAGISAESVVAAAAAAGIPAVVTGGIEVVLEGAAAESLRVDGRGLAEIGVVHRIPALRSHLPGAPSALVIENPTSRRAEVLVNGVLIGRLLPRATGAVVSIPAGAYAVGLVGPDGERRDAVLTTVTANPRMTAPPAATLLVLP